MNFLQEYQEHLEELMAQGGTPKEMEAAVREYNACGNPDLRPSSTFVTWFQTQKHFCSTCGNPFNLNNVTPTQRTLREESTCPACLSGSTTPERTEPEDSDEAGDGPRANPSPDERR